MLRRWLQSPVAAITLILSIGVVLALTVRTGQEWDGDFALYLMDARNIVLGLPYAKTGYLLNPANAINPSAYPPGVPLLFAPIYWLSGINLLQLKILCIATLLGFMWFFYNLSHKMLSQSYALLLTAIVGLHPFVVESENSPASEFPFMLFCYAALYFLDRLTLERSTAKLIALAGFATAMAYLTRSIGILLFPAAFLASVYHSRRLITPANLALGAAAVLVLLAQVTFPTDVATYVHYFDNFSIHTVWLALERYLGVRTVIFGKIAVVSPATGIVLGIFLALLAIMGFIARLRSRASIYEVFFLIYLVFLVLYPITLDVARYAMPVWPLLFLYAAFGLHTLLVRIGEARARLSIALAVVLSIGAIYAYQFASMSFGHIPYSVEDSPSRELFGFIKEHVPADEAVLTRKPTIIALYSGHLATIWPEHFSDSELWAFMSRLHAGYLIQDRYHLGVHPRPNDALDAFVNRNRGDLEQVFENGWFAVYRSRLPLPGAPDKE